MIIPVGIESILTGEDNLQYLFTGIMKILVGIDPSIDISVDTLGPSKSASFG